MKVCVDVRTPSSDAVESIVARPDLRLPRDCRTLACDERAIAWRPMRSRGPDHAARRVRSYPLTLGVREELGEDERSRAE